MMRYCTLLFALAFLITAGCIEEYTPPDPNATATPVPLDTTAATRTPAPTQTPPPAEMAYISGIKCAVGDRSEATYHCDGNVRIATGAYGEVQVIARYKDNNTFRSGVVSLGGDEPVSRPFSIFPDIRYKGQTPDYFVRMDRAVYPVTGSSSGGTAWSNLPADRQLGEPVR